MKKDIKDYLHLYLGCKISTSRNGTFLSAAWLEKALEDECDGQLILRPLSDMTEEEAVEMASLTEWEPHFRDVKVERNKITNDIIVTWDGANESRDMVNATGDLFWCYEQFMWFLKKGFDIFELIEEGLAIDKTTLTP